MNVRYMVENGERLLKEGNQRDGQRLLQMAQDYITRSNPDGRVDLHAICCYTSIIKNGETVLIHCGEDDVHPLFPGALEERKKLCFACQKWCLGEIAKLKSK